jgi:nucleoside phosphorylase
VLADVASVSSIQQHSRKLVGIDMEAYGVMYAAYNSFEPAPLAFSIKTVSDYADSSKDDSFREYAAYASATLLHRIALKYLSPQ